MGAIDDLKIKLAAGGKVRTYKRRSAGGKVVEVKEYRRGGGPGKSGGKKGLPETAQHQRIRENFEENLEKFGREKAAAMRARERKQAHAERRKGDRRKKKDRRREVTKLSAREFPEKSRKKMAKSGSAMPGGGFPIPDVDALKRAIQAIGRAKNPEAAKAHIRKRAKALGREDLIPDTW